MKKILLFMMSVLGVLSFSSCSEDSDGLTDIIYYPHLSITGDQFYINPIGQAYVDPGCTATYNGEDYTSNIVTTGIEDIDINKAGLYTVTYSATSPKTDLRPQGYSMSATRTVAVCDPSITTNISGTYTGQAGTYRMSGTTQTDYPGFTTTVTQAAPGIFYFSDIMNGYYSQRAGYGNTYSMTGYVQLLADGTLNILSGHVNGWGDDYTDFKDGKYDASTGTISYIVTYAGMEFHVVMTK